MVTRTYLWRRSTEQWLEYAELDIIRGSDYHICVLVIEWRFGIRDGHCSDKFASARKPFHPVWISAFVMWFSFYGVFMFTNTRGVDCISISHHFVSYCYLFTLFYEVLFCVLLRSSGFCFLSRCILLAATELLTYLGNYQFEPLYSSCGDWVTYIFSAVPAPESVSCSTITFGRCW